MVDYGFIVLTNYYQTMYHQIIIRENNNECLCDSCKIIDFQQKNTKLENNNEQLVAENNEQQLAENISLAQKNLLQKRIKYRHIIFGPIKIYGF